jgi:hypothetical protein
MALPVLAKTWEFNVNNTIVATSRYNFYRTVLLFIKNTFIGFTNNPWTVVGSSDGISADDIPNTSNDYWNVISDLDWNTAGNAHSWIVLERVDGAQICLDCNDTTSYPYRIDAYFSPAGTFTGGTTTNRPTYTDAVYMSLSEGNAKYFAGYDAADPILVDMKLHFWHSTDGLITRMVAFSNNVPHTIWRIENIQDPRTGHTPIPAAAGIFSGTSTTNQLDVTSQEDNDT